MEIEEIKTKANDMLKNFVNCLGLNGDYYVSVNKCPMIFGNFGGISKFLTAESKELKKFLDSRNFDEKKKKYIYSEGLIQINRKYQNAPADADLFVTIIHEKIHSNRMILLNSQFSENKEITSIFYDNNHFVQNSKSNKPYYADASQDILKSSIDNSKKTINKYSSMSEDAKEDIFYENEEYYEDKMLQQQKIDEALVETMAIVAYQLYVNGSNDIIKAISNLNAKSRDGEDIKAITNIILRHNNLELFKWMIDPLSYQIDDVNYDYFANYITKGDMDDYINLIESEEIMLDDDKFDANIISSRHR